MVEEDEDVMEHDEIAEQFIDIRSRGSDPIDEEEVDPDDDVDESRILRKKMMARRAKEKRQQEEMDQAHQSPPKGACGMSIGTTW